MAKTPSASTYSDSPKSPNTVSASGLAASSGDGLGWVELGAAILITVGLIVLQVVVMRHSGPLWRDEISTLHVVQSPSFAEMLRLHWYDSFPSVIHVVLRGWMGLGLGGSDDMLRILPFIFGVGVMAALWWTARRLGLRAPLIALVLFGLSPTCLRYGTGVRAYSLGLVLMFLLVGLYWWMIQKPTWRRVLVTAVAAVLAVQTVYVNAFMLLATSLAAGVVCLRRRQWKKIGIILGIGVAAAVSLAPYVPAFQRSADWAPLIKIPITTIFLFSKFTEAVECGLTQTQGDPILSVWLVVGLAGLAALAYRANLSATDQPPERKDLTLYVLASLVAGAVCFYAYLWFISVTTQVWYYIPILALVALLADAGLDGLIGRNVAGRLARLGLVLVLVAVTGNAAWEAAHLRWTNMDLAAARVQALAEQGDYIVVNPHYLGTSFDRYYKGTVPWTTLPEMDQYYFQSYTSFKQKMEQKDPIKPILDRIVQTLASGHRVWVVGGASLLQQGEQPGDLAPAPNSPAGWSESAYVQLWSRQAAYVIQTHCNQLGWVKIPVDDPVIPFENVPLMVAQFVPPNPPR